jgi:ABC-type glycerol-3-phosphate transport system substrate-binding protein
MSRQKLETPMTKDELIDLLEASTDIPDDAQIFLATGEGGGMERMTDFVYNEATNAIEIY